MIDQQIIDKYGLIQLDAHFGQAVIHNVGLYELPTEKIDNVLISDGDSNGIPVKEGEYRLWTTTRTGIYKEVKECIVTHAMMMDVDKNIFLSMLNNFL